MVQIVKAYVGESLPAGIILCSTMLDAYNITKEGLQLKVGTEATGRWVPRETAFSKTILDKGLNVIHHYQLLGDHATTCFEEVDKAKYAFGTLEVGDEVICAIGLDRPEQQIQGALGPSIGAIVSGTKRDRIDKMIDEKCPTHLRGEILNLLLEFSDCFSDAIENVATPRNNRVFTLKLKPNAKIVTRKPYNL